MSSSDSTGTPHRKLWNVFGCCGGGHNQPLGPCSSKTSSYNGRVGALHCTYFVDGGNNVGGDNAQHWSWRSKVAWQLAGWVNGWLAAPVSDYSTTPWLHLSSWNLPDSQFCSKSKTELKCSRHRTKLGEGDSAQKKCIPGGGDTAHIFWTGFNRGGHHTSKQAPSTHWIC